MSGAGATEATGAPEHARRTRIRYRTLGLNWGAARWGRPLVGGAVGMAIVVTFLAVRGGEPGGDVNPLTGTARGGWNRDEDIVLALVAGGALAAAIAVTFLAEYLRHWTAFSVALMLGRQPPRDPRTRRRGHGCGRRAAGAHDLSRRAGRRRVAGRRRTLPPPYGVLTLYLPALDHQMGSSA